MNARARALRVLLAGATLTALAWALAPAPSPPLYDGLQPNAEPYRYLNPPPGSPSTQPPTSATMPLSVSGGVSSAGYLATTEQPPQAQFVMAEGSFAVPAGATSVTVSVKAVPPPAAIPGSLGRLDGNVYEVGATAGGAAVQLNPKVNTPPTIVLRGPVGSAGGGSVVSYQDGAWKKLHTVPIGTAQDTLAAGVSGLGDFALVVPVNGGGSTGGGGGGSFPFVAVVLPAVALVVIAGVLVAVRTSRSRARPRTSRRR